MVKRNIQREEHHQEIQEINKVIIVSKLYRIVPDTTITYITTGLRPNTNEDLLYNFGCFSSYDNVDFGIYNCNSGITNEQGTNSLFFFTSPWSCIMALKYMRSQKYQAKILEYDIPDEIIASSVDVITNYTDWQAKGKLVDINKLKSQNPVDINVLKFAIEQIALQDMKLSLKSFCSSNKKYDYDKCCDFIQNAFNRIISSKLNSFNAEKVFYSDFITEKTLIIQYDDFENLYLNNIPELDKLICRSNGIFTHESLQEYDYDSASYRHGFVL